jgi:hypothetical protein
MSLQVCQYLILMSMYLLTFKLRGDYCTSYMYKLFNKNQGTL